MILQFTKWKRIFRIVNTKHQKSGLFKIQLQWDTVTNKPESIVKIARYFGDTWELDEVPSPNEGLSEVFQSLRMVEIKKEDTVKKEPYRSKTWKQNTIINADMWKFNK